MTGDDMLSEPHDCSGDAAAYALGAMDHDEARRFELHLAQCAVCRDEVGALRQAAELLPLAVTRYEAPRELRRRVLRALRTEPGPAAAQRTPRRRPRLGALGLPARPALSMGVVTALVVAVLVAVSVGGGGAGTRVVTASLSGWSGSAKVRVSGGQGTLIVSHMPAPASGHVYEVWLLLRGHSAPSPTNTLFSVSSSGAADIGLPGSLSGVSEVLVTPEPAGGSRVPTHAPVIIARLA
jgi:anti-sigma-K factor RskA